MENVSESDDVKTSIIHLPDDCLSFIYQRLDNLNDHDSFGLTCHRWLNIQNTNRRSLQFQCSLSLLINNPSTLSQTIPPVNSGHLHRLLTRFQWLEHLSLSGCTVLNDSSLSSLRLPGARLQSLHLDCCYGVSDDGISTVASFCPNLRVVSLYRCSVSDVGLETLARGSLRLRCLNLSYCPLVSDSGVKALAQACLQIESVKISNCKRVTGVGFSDSSPTLGYVDAECCQLEPEGVAGIVSGGGIEFLNISGAVCYIRRDGLVPIGSGIASKLRILNLRMCRTVGDESIKAIAEGCPLLQEWNLALCHEVRVWGWEAVGKWCCKLEKLHVNRCRNLCDQGLLAIRSGCKSLQVLYMNGNARLTPTAVEMFRLHRGDVTIRSEEVMVIGPDWRLYTRG